MSRNGDDESCDAVSADLRSKINSVRFKSTWMYQFSPVTVTQLIYLSKSSLEILPSLVLLKAIYFF